MAIKRYVYKKRNHRKRKIKRFGGFLFISSGIGLMFYFFFPIFSFHIYLSTAISELNIETPLPNVSGLFTTGVANATEDSTDARSWFPDQAVQERQEKVKEYYLSIPTQGIYNAKVSSTDYDLSKHLVQYFSTSDNPTENGTTVIFGHSSIPQWFDPDDYTKIFAKIHQLKLGEEIILTVEGEKFRYKILSKTILSNKDPKVFYQNFDNSYISLVTCTPPGTTWKRLVVRAALLKG